LVQALPVRTRNRVSHVPRSRKRDFAHSYPESHVGKIENTHLERTSHPNLNFSAIEYVYSSRWPLDHKPRRLKNDVYRVELPRTWCVSQFAGYSSPSFSRTTTAEFMTRYCIPEPWEGFRRTAPVPSHASLYEEVPEQTLTRD
jgi:hypothetical protein